ncbi:hypothetical protein ACI3EJ_04025 [Ligilactobacillus acidipiscis]|uniref:hypothetical protein n=1 Tax=Ligilactobacillus acidipiscis TaxID=89059 RepID=UPI003868636E
MNIWTRKSIELANQDNYLDLLYKVYPMSSNIERKLPRDFEKKLSSVFKTRSNQELIELCLRPEIFPVKDSYVSYLRLDPKAIKRNPETVNRIAGIIYEMGLNEVLKKMKSPKETNRQIGPLFKHWIAEGYLGVPVFDNEGKFMSYKGNCVFNTNSDDKMKLFAEKNLGYSHEKGLDFIGKFNGKYVIAEAKFLTDRGGHQNAQLADALNTMRSELKDTNRNVIKIAVLDGVIYIPNKGKMYQSLKDAKDNEVIISAILLRDYLFSI